MPITTGSLSGRVWRVTDALPPDFTTLMERNLKRHAFRPIDPEKGEIHSKGWTNARQVLDTDLTAAKVLYRDMILLGLRVDRISINMRVFRALLGEQIGKTLREKKRDRLSDEERTAVEDKVRNDLIRKQPPSMSVHEMIWLLERGIVVFGATANKINNDFSELFSETFNVSIEPMVPFLRAHRWAKRQGQVRSLRELLPSPLSPRAPAQVVEVGDGMSDID